MEIDGRRGSRGTADVQVLDAIRVAPGVVRAFEAGPDGLEFLAFGLHRDADGETVDDPWIESRESRD